MLDLDDTQETVKSMEILDLRKTTSTTASEDAAETLREGGVILYPTDTLYGLGADAFSDAAVDKVYAIKGRDPKKPLHAVFANVQMIEEYAEVNDLARALMDKFLPGPLTLVLQKKPQVKGGIARGMETIGVRIPDNIFCVETAKILGKPYTATSANLAGSPTGKSVSEILGQLADAKFYIDLVIDAGELSECAPSTVVDVSNGGLQILREGAIKASELQKIL